MSFRISYSCYTSLMTPSPDHAWKHTVRAFADEMRADKGLHSVKDLCAFLLDDKQAKAFRMQEDVIEYLQDYVGVGMVHYEFHKKWKKIPGLEAIAEYDKQEMAKVVVLIQLLGEQE